MELQRKWLPVIRAAIVHYDPAHDGMGDDDYSADGYTVLVSRDANTPGGAFRVGLYLPGSTPEGECDWYGLCTADGEERRETVCAACGGAMHHSSGMADPFPGQSDGTPYWQCEQCGQTSDGPA